ncbi:NAD-dependent epimerase/dehydratase family protein [Micromonospora sp. CPCC 205371]|nr:NAD-dependent epimerase/dehydratase family protein [Micromonospora sp. CPCC 205371]
MENHRVKIAVTGGRGFIGQATLRAADAAGHDVFAFDRPDDILGNLDGLAGADHVIHLAGVLGTSELFDAAEEAITTNVVGTLRVLQWCEAHGAGFTAITMPPVFPSVYTATKICADRLATAWHLAKGVPVSHVRAFNAYGAGQKHGPGHPQKILPTFATEAWHGRPIPIWGDGKQTVDLVHADDIGRMLIEATGHGDDAVFDAGTGIAVSVNELADAIINITGSTGGKLYLPMRAGEIPTHIVAEGEGWDRLDWRPELDWARVEEAVHWYRPA